VKYYFDLDETLCLTPSSRDYTQAVPLIKVIDEVNKLFDDDHEITIYTARGGTSGIDYHDLNIQQLSSWGVKYHHLIDTGKPPYEILVDDRAINTTTWRENRGIKLTGFVASCFDLLHAGHCLYLKESKSLCDHLIAGLQIDPIDRPHKNTPIQSIDERLIQLQSCRYVDEIVQYTTEDDLDTLLESLRPDIRFVGSDCKDGPITGAHHSSVVYFHERSHHYSSSELRERISYECR
jgi:glycerol-3-phosphate cytidylyltransferase